MKNWKNYIPAFPISTSEELKSALVKRFSKEYAGVAAARLIYQAVNEAYALVALTTEPLLLLPALAEEKVQSAAAWSARQSSLLQGHSLALRGFESLFKSIIITPKGKIMSNITSNKLAGKVAVVTGASKGIGAAIAIQLAADGASARCQLFKPVKTGAAQVVSEIIAQGGKRG